MNEGKEKKPVATTRNLLKALSIICFTMIFCPAFLVSCSGQKVNVNVLTAVGGLRMDGSLIVDPKPAMLIAVVIPIIFLIVIFAKEIAANTCASTLIICAMIDVAVWLFFRAGAKRLAEENLCRFETTGWYYLNMIALFLIVVLSMMVFAGKVEMDKELMLAATGGGVSQAATNVGATVKNAGAAVKEILGTPQKDNAQISDAAGFCWKCGTPVPYGIRSCTSCGTAVPEEMLVAAQERKKAEEAARKEAEEKAKREAEEAARREAEEKDKREAEEKARREAEEAARRESEVTVHDGIYCVKCGTPLDADARFCTACGAQVPDFNS